MDASGLVTAFLGALVGAIGALAASLYVQDRQYRRNARNAARAVYFELRVNEIAVQLGLRHGSYQPLAKGSYERLLPELATWLVAHELDAVSRAYMSQAGYDQIRSDPSIPTPVRTALLQRAAADHARAMRLLEERAFSRSEVVAMQGPEVTVDPRRRAAGG